MSFDPQFLDQVRDALRGNRISLPAMPEVATKVSQYADDPSMSAGELGRLISADPALAGRLLQIANSPFFRGLKAVDNIQAAISRLGAICVRNLVTSLVVGNMFERTAAPAIRRPLRAAWEHGTRVAAYSYVIARSFTATSPDEALLAGLVHNIGVLPLLMQASQDSTLMADFDALLAAVDESQSEIGAVLTELWSFPADVVHAVAEHEQLDRDTQMPPDLTDVVCVANLHCRLGTRHPLARVNWSEVPAFGRLGLTPEASIAAMREARAQIEGLQRLLRG